MSKRLNISITKSNVLKMKEEKEFAQEGYDLLEQKGNDIGGYGLIARAHYVKTRWLLYRGFSDEAKNLARQLRVLIREHNLTYLDTITSGSNL